MFSDNSMFPAITAQAPLAVASRHEAINTHLGVGATDDRAATDLWLAEHSNPQTLRNYRREVDRALIWARLLGKSLAQITLVDWTNFRDALTSRAKYDSLAAAVNDVDARGGVRSPLRAAGAAKV